MARKVGRGGIGSQGVTWPVQAGGKGLRTASTGTELPRLRLRLSEVLELILQLLQNLSRLTTGNSRILE